MSLTSVVSDESRRPELVRAGAQEIYAEVDTLTGLKGTAVKTGLKAIGKVRPRFVEDNINKLMPEFAVVLDPHYKAAKVAGDVETHFISNGDEIAEDLLAITDRKAAASGNQIAVKTYQKLRGSAIAYIIAAMPRLAAFVVAYGD